MPAQAHISFDELLSAGLFAIITAGEPGAHGAEVAGTHGAGVNTPAAAAVAATTWGFDGDEHIPKDIIFFIGTLSIIVATGELQPKTLFSGVTVRDDGAAPKEH